MYIGFILFLQSNLKSTELYSLSGSKRTLVIKGESCCWNSFSYGFIGKLKIALMSFAFPCQFKKKEEEEKKR